MRFHALLIVRDEADIIDQTLDHLLSWADALYAYDTGSTDETWEIIRQRARADERIVPVGSEPVVFHAGVRAMLFDRYRQRFSPGDWIARVDADEFYHILPPAFVRSRVEPYEQLVCGQLYDFVLLHREASAWEQGRDDRLLPIEARRRHYAINAYPEIRLMRYRRSLRWPATHEAPRHLWPIARARIPVRHYRWRDPPQARTRWALRAAMHESMPIGGSHWNINSWRDRLRRADDPLVRRWPTDQPLPAIDDTGHITRGLRRTLGVIAGRLGVPGWLDRVSAGFDPFWEPTPLPSEVRSRLERLRARQA